MRLGLLFVSTVAGLLSVQIAKTQPIETVEVIGVTSLGGTVDLDRVAANVQVATSEDIRRRRAVSLADFMNSEFGSVFVNEAQSNPVQPDLQYRGYIGFRYLVIHKGSLSIRMACVLTNHSVIRSIGRLYRAQLLTRPILCRALTRYSD